MHASGISREPSLLGLHHFAIPLYWKLVWRCAWMTHPDSVKSTFHLRKELPSNDLPMFVCSSSNSFSIREGNSAFLHRRIGYWQDMNEVLMLESGSAFRAVSPPAVPPMRFAFSHQATGTAQRQNRAADSTRMAAWSLAQV